MIRDAWRRYRASLDWIEEVFYLATLAAEACMIYPWQALVSAWMGYPPLPLWALCLLLWTSYLISRFFAHARLGQDRKQALVAALILLTALTTVRLHVYGARNPWATPLPLGEGMPAPSRAYRLWELGWIADMVDDLVSLHMIVPAPLLVLIVVFVSWWRGIVASRHAYDTQRAWYGFRLGVILLAAFFFVTLFGRRLDISGVVFAYFFSGLLSIALSSIIEQGGIRQSTMGSRQWLGLLATAILGNLGLALLVSLLVSRRAVATALGWLRPVGQLSGFVHHVPAVAVDRVDHCLAPAGAIRGIHVQHLSPYVAVRQPGRGRRDKRGRALDALL